MVKCHRLVVMCLALLFATSAFSEQESLVGKRCPSLIFEDRMIQGVKVAPEDFLGRVVYCVIFQRGCPHCESVALPHFQEVYEANETNGNALVIGVNVAPEKNASPGHVYTADRVLTRLHLELMGYTFPVAQDKEEQSYRQIKVPISFGPRTLYTSVTPMGFVLDASGVVKSCEAIGNEKGLSILDMSFSEELKKLGGQVVPPLPPLVSNLDDCVELVDKGMYGAATQLAAQMINDLSNSAGASASAKDDARYLYYLLKNSCLRNLENAKLSFRYDPPAAISRLLELKQLFEGCEFDATLRDAVLICQKFPAYRSHHENYEQLAKELAAVTQELHALEDMADVDPSLITELERLVEAGIETRVSEQAQQCLHSIECGERVDIPEGGHAQDGNEQEDF